MSIRRVAQSNVYIYILAQSKCSYFINDHNGLWIVLTSKFHKKMRYNLTLKG